MCCGGLKGGEGEKREAEERSSPLVSLSLSFPFVPFFSFFFIKELRMCAPLPSALLPVCLCLSVCVSGNVTVCVCVFMALLHPLRSVWVAQPLSVLCCLRLCVDRCVPVTVYVWPFTFLAALYLRLARQYAGHCVPVLVNVPLSPAVPLYPPAACACPLQRLYIGVCVAQPLSVPLRLRLPVSVCPLHRLRRCLYLSLRLHALVYAAVDVNAACGMSPALLFHMSSAAASRTRFQRCPSAL